MTRKIKVNIAPSQKLEYAKLMVEKVTPIKKFKIFQALFHPLFLVVKDNMSTNYQAIPQRKLMR